jgi:hypothetical protein
MRDAGCFKKASDLLEVSDFKMSAILVRADSTQVSLTRKIAAGQSESFEDASS